MIIAVRDFLWGVPGILFLGLFSVYFTVRTRGVQITGLGSALKSLFSGSKKGSGISSLGALSVVLGGTVGIGSISGVGIAIAAGGPGSVFWMWICGLLCGALKYAEVFLSVRFRRRNGLIWQGGAMYCLDALGKKKAAVFFSVSCILASYSAGGLVQAAAAGDVLSASGIPRPLCGLLLAVVASCAVFGGQKIIARAETFFVPAASALYLTLLLMIILPRVSLIPDVLERICSSAFGLPSAAGGLAGWSVQHALRVGVTRGIFSTEAGMGSSPIAHAASEEAFPVAQGKIGVFEVFADTFVFSTLTALALLSCGTDQVFWLFSVSFGTFGEITLPILLVIFAIASILSWGFYGESCLQYLFGERKIFFFISRLLTVFFAYLGGILPAIGNEAWAMADCCNLLMMLPNGYLLFLCRKQITAKQIPKPARKKAREGLKKIR